MNIIRKGFLVTAAAVTLAFSAAGSAQAHAYADSILNINNLRFLNSGGTQFAASDFSTLVVNNSRTATGTAIGYVPETVVSFNGPACAGVCPAIPFAPRFAPGPVPPIPFNTFGYGDTSLTGSAIESGGANASTRAAASAAPGQTLGSGNTGTTSSFIFALGEADSMTVAFDADAYTVAHVPLGTTASSSASARLTWSIQIIDLDSGESVLSFSPTALNGDSNVSRTEVLPGTTTYTYADFFEATSEILTAGTTYQLTINHSSFADATQEAVPEPATLAIIAGGLLSMSLVSRRRKS